MACLVCGGDGYVLDEHEPTAAIPDGHMSVQPCDWCGVFRRDARLAALTAAAIEPGYLTVPIVVGGEWCLIPSPIYQPT